MIVAMTKMKRMPETCKQCSASEPELIIFGSKAEGRVCSVAKRSCPTERKPNGCMGYTMPEWCPLMDIDLLEVEDDG